MPYDLGVIKRQRREPPVISTSTYGGNFVGFYSSGTTYYAVHAFTSSGQFTKPSYVTTTTAQVLVVAGGGGGGGPATAGGVGGGGGAGGVINSSTYSITATLTISIGGGGATNVSGSVSTVNNGVVILSASGGGRGGAPTNGSGAEGGSGGGGSGTGTGGASTSTQGNVGGGGGSQTAYAGGGGGASTAGGTANASAAGQGGSGTIILITGSPIWLAGGGGGGANAVGYKNGSYGGGGSGGTSAVVTGVSGTTNSGGGGGGGGGTTGVGGSGGSGMVIITYAIPANLYPKIQSDPYFKNNTLLLNYGPTTLISSNVIANVISDSSLNSYAISNFNNVAASTLNPFDPSSYHSLYFNGSAYLTVSAGALPALANNFTVELWMYATSSDNITNHFLVGAGTSNGFYVYHRNNYISIGQIGGSTYSSPTAFTLNQWVHVAIVRSGNTFYIYQNGSAVLTQSWSPTFVSGIVTIGGLATQGSFHTGYLSNIRSVTYPVYTGNFLPSLIPLGTIQNAASGNTSAINTGTTLLTGRFSTTSTSIVDYSTLTNIVSVTRVTASSLNPFASSVTYNSVQITGTNYLSSTKTSGWLSGTHTVEAWVYLSTSTNASTSMLIAGTYKNLYTTWGWEWTINNYLMTLSFKSTTNNGYNPLKVKTAATTAINTGGQLLTDISLYGATDNITFPDFKWNFLYPPNPFNNRYGSFANMNVVDSNSTPTYFTFRPKFIAYADRKDFTFETWIFIDPTSSYSGPIFQGLDWALGVSDNSARKLVFIYRRWILDGSRQTRDYYPYLEGRNYNSFTSTSSVPTGQWVHVALVVTWPNSYGQYNFYINGVQDSSSGNFLYNTDDVMNPNNYTIYLGGGGNFSIQFSSDYYGTYLNITSRLSAFISNARVVIGVAVYTGNFTVPTDNLSITQSSGTNISAIVSNTATVLLTAVTTASITQQVFSTSTWYHVAFTKSGTNVSLYVNGVNTGTLTLIDTDFEEQNTLQIGRGLRDTSLYYGYYYGTPFYGNISNFRIINGTAIYANNFTVPNGPLQITQVANPYGGSNTTAFTTGTTILAGQFYSYYQGSTGFVDYGTNDLGITPTGNPGQGTFSPFGNNWSTLFNGTTDYLNIPVIYSSSATLTSLNFGANDWTIETWAYLTANTGTAYIAGQYNTGNFAPVGLYISANKTVLAISNAGSQWNITSTAPNVLSTGTWNHIAAVRNSTRLSLYINGTEQVYSVTSSPSADISINSATLVSTNITNSTLNPYDQGPYHSLYFDGASYLNLPANTGFNFGTGDVTIECWVYLITYVVGGATASETIDFFTYASGSYLSGQCQLQINSAGTVSFIYATTVSAATTLSTTAVIPLSAWTHIAVVRTGTTLAIYINGVLSAGGAGSITVGQNLGTNGAGSIGKQTNTNNYYFNGYISNIRIVKTLVLYSGSSFSIPQSVLSTIQSATPNGAIANLTTNTTQLLVGRFINAKYFFDDYSSNNFTLTNNSGVGAANLSPSITSTSTFNSMYFNGTSQYLTLSGQSAFAFGTGDFTIEFWLYVTALPSSSAQLFDNRPASTQGAYPLVYLSSNGTIRLWVSSADRITSSAISISTWYHVVVSRSGTTTKMFINGTQVGSSYTDTTSYLTSAVNIGAGYSGAASISNYLNGYISNLRVVKGTAAYTSNFTVPSTQLSAINGTSLLIAKSSPILGEGLNQLTADLSFAPVAVSTGTSNNNFFAPSNLYPPFGASTSTLYNSVYFPGNGIANAKIDYTNSNFATGTGDFTVECWVWMNSSTISTGGILASCSASLAGFIIARDLLGIFNANGSGGVSLTWTFPTGAWTHVALCLQSNNMSAYLNGVAVAGSPVARTAGSLTSTTISTGKRYTSDSLTTLIGYVSNIRFVAGLAVYTGNFTLPTAPLRITQSANPYGGSNTQAILTSTYTKLLAISPTSATNIIDYSTNTSIMSIGSGTVTLSTLDPFSIYTATNYHSLYFSGNSSISVTSATGWLNYGDHSVEAWVNLNTTTYSSMLIAGTYNGVGTTGWEWSINNYWMTLGYISSGALTTFTSSPTPLTLNQLLTDNANGSSITNNGVTFNTANPSTSYYGTLAFGGSAYLTTPNSSAITLDTGDFTIEAWVYTTVLGGQNGIFGKREAGQYIGVIFRVLNTTNKLVMQIADASGSAWAITDTSDFGLPALIINTWNHVALVRNGSSFRIYQNGVGGTSYTYSGTITHNSSPGYIGKSDGSSGNQFWNGYINNFRIVKGIAVYTDNFTIPSIPLFTTQSAGTNIQAISTASYTSLLLGVSPSTSTTFIPNTWNHVAFSRLGTTASMYINGVRTTVTQIVSYTEQNTLRLGYMGFSTATSTYLSGYISNFRIASGVAVYTGTNFVPPTGILTTQQPANPYGTSTNITNAITFNTTTRIATALFNGVSVLPYTTNTNMLIGRAGSAVTSMFPGYLSNFRIVNGTAVYTSAFTPPTAPLSRIPNTSLLVAASGYHVDKSANTFVVNTGTVASAPAITKFTPYKIPGEYNKSMVGGSVYFSTTTAAAQNLSLGTQNSLALGSGNYNVELWVYAQSYNALNSSLLDWRTNAGTTAGVPVLYMLAAGTIQWQNTGGTGFLTSPAPLPLNTWNHIAMVRYNSILYMYINGVVVAAAADSTTLTIQTFFINSPITASNQTLFGFISNVRILVGANAYTPTFTVPTTSLTSVTNTVLLALQNDAPAFKDNSANNFALTKPTTSTVFQQVLSPFGGSGSAYFNGKNNYLVVNTGTNVSFAFGNSDFTIEAWIYPTARNIYYGSLIVGGITYTTTIISADWFFMVNPSGFLYFQIGTSSSSGLLSNTRVSLNVWSHVACVRTNGSTIFYLNGKLVASSTTPTVYTTSTIAGGSLSFNGTSSQLGAIGTRNDFVFLSDGTSNWTAETWFYANSVVGDEVLFSTSYASTTFGNGAYGILCTLTPSTGIVSVGWIAGAGNGTYIATYSGVFTTGLWYHLAVTFNSTTRVATLFINGILRASGTVSAGTLAGADYGLQIGKNPAGNYFNGYISNFRVTKSVVYGGTSGSNNFTPILPLTTITNMYLLLSVSSSSTAFIDSSVSNWSISNTAVTYNTSAPTSSYNLTGSLRFDTTNDIYVGAASNWGFLHNALQDYTIECWFYTTSTAYQQILGTADATSYTGIEFSINYSNGVTGSAAQGSVMMGFNRGVGGQSYLPNTITGLFSTSTWNHVAVTFTTSTKTVTFFVNGVARSVDYNSGNQSNTSFAYSASDPSYPLYIGAAPPFGAFNGYISNVRITKSILYFGNFIVPTAELATTQAADTNVSAILTASYVSLLTAQHSGIIDTSTYAYSIVNLGGVTYSSSVSPNLSYVSTLVTNIGSTQNIVIGATLNSTATTFNGYISNLSVLRNSKYSSAFTPPAIDLTSNASNALLTLLSTDTTFVDSSANSFAISNSTTATTLQGFSPFGTNYSMYFNGSSSISLSPATPLNLSSSTNWTIEAWVNPIGNYSVGNSVLFAKRNAVVGLPTYNSMYFSGSAYLQIYSPNNYPFIAAGASDFTIECWVNFSATPTNSGIFHLATIYNPAAVTGLALAYVTGGWTVYWGNGINTTNIVPANVPAAGVWYHVALVRSSSILYLYVNGTSYVIAASLDTTDYSLLTNLSVGLYWNASYTMVGNISNFRITQSAVYTGNFIPPTIPLYTTQLANPSGGFNTQAVSTASYTTLLIGKFSGSSPTISDYGNNTLDITNVNVSASAFDVGIIGSLYFNGATQYLIAPVGASTFGTGDFTIEAWIYKTSDKTATLLDNATGNTDNNYWSLGTWATGYCSFYVRDSAAVGISVTGSILSPLNKWVHVAVTRQSGLVRLFIDGVLDNSGTITKSITARVTNIGSFQYTGYLDYYNGYMSNVRIVTGAAIYTTAFTPSYSPLSNTQTVNLSGSPSIAIPNPNYSVVLSTTQYLTISSSSGPTFAFGTGDFTVECWVYITTALAAGAFIGPWTGVAATSAWVFTQGSPTATNLRFGISDGTTITFYQGTGGLSTNSWIHIAAVRVGTALSLYSNGSSVAGFAGVSTNISVSSQALQINGIAGLAFMTTGYISNIRVVRGQAVYTGNFAVPKNALTVVQSSSTNISAITSTIAGSNSLFFNAAISGLTITSNSTFNLGNISFTMECWVYVTGSSNNTIWTLGTSGVATYTLFAINPDYSVTFQTNSGSWTWTGAYTTPAAIVTINTWIHLAAVRDKPGATFKIFVNGQEQFSTGSFNEPVGQSGTAFIGSYFQNSDPTFSFKGYITNFRLVSGVAVYTGNFTVPTIPLSTTQAADTNIAAISYDIYTVLLIKDTIADFSRYALTVNNYASSVITGYGITPFVQSSTGTILLTAQNQTIVDNSYLIWPITNVGGATTSITNPLITTATTLLVAKFVSTATSLIDSGSAGYSITNTGAVTTATLTPFNIVSSSPTASYQGFLSTGTGYIGFYDGTSYFTSTTALSSGTWSHIAYTYDSTNFNSFNLSIYVNGYRVLNTGTTISDSGESLFLGGISGATEYLYGYISNFRLVKGYALYLGSYFPAPSLALTTVTNTDTTVTYPSTSSITTSLLTLQNSYSVDNSVNAYSLTLNGTPRSISFSPFSTNTNLSTYFNGTTDFINVAAKASLSLGTGDFTIEVWVHPTLVPTAYAPVLDARTSTAGVPWIVGMQTSGGVLKPYFYDGTTRTGATTIQLYTWTHLAYTRTNSILRMFVNGAVDYIAFNNLTNMVAQGTNQLIGKMWDGTNNMFQGYMSNLRVINGTSLYTANFNPSQIPLGVVSGVTTNLLTTLADGRGIDYSGNSVAKASTSSLVLSSSITKYNLYSMSFNGTTDQLIVQGTGGFAYGANDFTWEMWVYPTSPAWSSTSTVLLDHAGNQGGLRYSQNIISYYAAFNIATSTSSVVLNVNSGTWTHLAVSRNNNVSYVFVNGAFVVSTNDTSTYTSQSITIGNTSTGANNYFQGYIEDLRITKGVARYVSSFVPPIKLSNR